MIMSVKDITFHEIWKISTAKGDRQWRSRLGRIVSFLKETIYHEELAIVYCLVVGIS